MMNRRGFLGQTGWGLLGLLMPWPALATVGFRSRRAKKAKLTFLTTVSSTVDSASPSFSGVNFGTPDSQRRIVVGVSSRSVSGSLTFSSITIGGVTADLIEAPASSSVPQTFAVAHVPNGASGDIVVNYSGAVSCIHVGVWRLDGVNRNTPFSSTSLVAVPNVNSVTIDIPARGVAIGLLRDASSTAVTWAGLSENFDATVEVINSSGASAEFAAAQTGYTITATKNGGATSSKLLVATWGP